MLLSPVTILPLELGPAVEVAVWSPGSLDRWLDALATLGAQVTDDATHDWDPAYSPDGQSIIWSSNRSGNMEIWLANADGSGAEMLAAGNNLLPEVSPDGQRVLYSTVIGLDFSISVLDVATDSPVDFKLEIDAVNRNADLVLGRARWSADGHSIVFVGQDEAGRVGVFSQPFRPGHDTRADKVRLSPVSSFYATESMGISPDGKQLVISAMFNRRRLMLAENFRLRDWQ